MDTIELPPGMRYEPISDDVFVLTVDHVMEDIERKALYEVLSKFLSPTFTDMRVIVLEPGMTLERIPALAVMERIEAKLDALLGHHGVHDDDNDVMDNQE